MSNVIGGVGFRKEKDEFIWIIVILVVLILCFCC
jgi:hypothetical protein